MQDISLWPESVMHAPFEVESTLTDRYQTTVPESVRRALRLGKRDKIHYTIRHSGEVVLTRAEASDGDDPVLGSFLVCRAYVFSCLPLRLLSVESCFVMLLLSLTGGFYVFLVAAVKR